MLLINDINFQNDVTEILICFDKNATIIASMIGNFQNVTYNFELTYVTNSVFYSFREIYVKHGIDCINLTH